MAHCGSWADCLRVLNPFSNSSVTTPLMYEENKGASGGAGANGPLEDTVPFMDNNEESASDGAGDNRFSAETHLDWDSKHLLPKRLKQQPDLLVGAGSTKVYVSADKTDRNIKYLIKCVNKDEHNKGKLDTLKHEASVLDELGGHPNIVMMQANVKNHRYQFLVLEFFGQSLFTYIDSVGAAKISKNEYKLVLQLFAALLFLQSKKFRHFDLKLDNVLVDQELNLKLCDFGSTFKDGAAELEGFTLGTICYMAPEVLHNVNWKYGVKPHVAGYNNPKTVTAAADIFSLAKLIWVMKTGEFLEYLIEPKSEEQYPAIAVFSEKNDRDGHYTRPAKYFSKGQWHPLTSHPRIQESPHCKLMIDMLALDPNKMPDLDSCHIQYKQPG